MVKKNGLEKGIYPASVLSLKKKDGRCTLKLKIFEQNKCINFDIHDEICETSGLSHLSSDFIRDLYLYFPSEIKISNSNGYWQIERLSQILSDAIIKII